MDIDKRQACRPAGAGWPDALPHHLRANVNEVGSYELQPSTAEHGRGESAPTEFLTLKQGSLGKLIYTIPGNMSPTFRKGFQEAKTGCGQQSTKGRDKAK